MPNTTQPRTNLSRRNVLLGGGVLATTVLLTALTHHVHFLAAQARRALNDRLGTAPPKHYVERLEVELAFLHRHHRWPLWEAAFKVAAAAHRAGVVLAPDDPEMLGSLTAHLLQLGNVDPVRWDVPLDYFLHRNSADYADFSLSTVASLAFIHELAATRVEVRTSKGDAPERVFLHFAPESGSPVVLRLFRDPRIDTLQLAQAAGFDRGAVDLGAVAQLAAQDREFAPPFDRSDTAWVAKGLTTFEEAAAALRLMRVEDAGWEPQPVLDDLWRVYFARGNSVPRVCRPFVERTGELLLYNEQIGRITEAVAGFSFREATEFRCAVRTQRPERMNQWRENFVSRAQMVSGLAPAEAHEVCDFLWRHPLLFWCRGSAVAETAEWIWTTHALRFLGASTSGVS